MTLVGWVIPELLGELGRLVVLRKIEALEYVAHRYGFPRPGLLELLLLHLLFGHLGFHLISPVEGDFLLLMNNVITAHEELV
mmetsp:Transcript_3655/g.6225  ORF Transcript_3655/g.6225 Transcript_3655/m.6225 type:complete len:82 (+) Transcript_3655:1308-1553(+)